MIRNRLKLFFQILFIVLLINQIFIFGACFAPYCIAAALPHTGVIAFLIISFFGDKINLGIFGDFSNAIDGAARKANEHIEAQKNGLEYPSQKPTTQEKSKNFQHTQSKKHLKRKGDIYELFIGNQFEVKGELVIYNGFIRGYEDGGVDVASISPANRTINLIQCKNWENRPLKLRDVQEIYRKLHEHPFDFLDLSAKDIYSFQSQKFDIGTIQQTINDTKKNLDHYTIRKTLYITSDKVVEPEIGKHLTMLQQNIFRYKDMKIVVKQSREGDDY